MGESRRPLKALLGEGDLSIAELFDLVFHSGALLGRPSFLRVRSVLLPGQPVAGSEQQYVLAAVVLRLVDSPLGEIEKQIGGIRLISTEERVEDLETHTDLTDLLNSSSARPN